MKVKTQSAIPAPAFYLVLSILLTVINYYVTFTLNDTLFKEEFNLSYFMASFIIVIVAQSAYIAYTTKNKLLAILGTNTVLTWALMLLFFGSYGLFSSQGPNLGYFVTNFGDTLEYIGLNGLLLLFSYLGAMIGLGLNPQKKRK